MKLLLFLSYILITYRMDDFFKKLPSILKAATLQPTYQYSIIILNPGFAVTVNCMSLYLHVHVHIMKSGQGDLQTVSASALGLVINISSVLNK